MTVSVDGRVARRERNSDAVLDAVHDLFAEGQQVPSVEEVAERAGVSLRSVYRYFPDTRQLMMAALARRIQVVEPDWHLAEIGQGTLDERIERFVEHRLFLYDRSAPTIRAALGLAGQVPAIAEQIERRRLQIADQARRHFAPELAALSTEDAETVLCCVDVLGQFESLEELRARKGMSSSGARTVLVTALRALLVP